jgi:hypothetical protein
MQFKKETLLEVKTRMKKEKFIESQIDWLLFFVVMWVTLLVLGFFNPSNTEQIKNNLAWSLVTLNP